MAGPLYLSAVEFIKKRPFDVYVPAFYHPYMPEELKNPQMAARERINRFRPTPVKRRNPLPFRQVMDPHQRQRAAYSIEVMLDMFQKKIEFELVNEEDIVEVFEGIDRYLISLRDDIRAGSEIAITYARLILQFREPTYKHYFRYMMNHASSLNSLYPNNDKEQNIFALMSALSGTSKEKYNLDPLRAKAKPPFELDVLKPKEEEEKSVNDDIENSFGIGTSKLAGDDGKDFNFDDFLKG